ncbi:MAG: glycerophosphodiester phosphodiesterase [Thermofilaceae archaeon]
MPRDFTVTGHRGAAALEPENTLPSFIKAVECGATGVEFDVYPTKDGVAVVLHDRELRRLTGVEALVDQLTYAEVSKLKVHGRARIPTLREVLAFAKGRLSVDIEVKLPGVEQEVVEALRELDMVDDALVTSFLPAPLAAVKKLDSSIEVGLLVTGWDDECLYVAERVGASYILPHYEAITPALVRKLTSRGFRVVAWTVNEAETARWLLDVGVDGVITDNPCLIRGVVEARKRG